MTPAKPMYQCGVCGDQAAPEVVAHMAQFQFECWVLHRIERKGGIVQVMTCPACASMTEDLIMESYKQRIRDGLVLGIQ